MSSIRWRCPLQDLFCAVGHIKLCECDICTQKVAHIINWPSGQSLCKEELIVTYRIIRSANESSIVVKFHWFIDRSELMKIDNVGCIFQMLRFSLRIRRQSELHTEDSCAGQRSAGAIHERWSRRHFVERFRARKPTVDAHRNGKY